MECNAKSKRSQKKCKGQAVTGSDKCRMHGGNHPVKHGLFSKYAPTRLAAKIDEARNDPRLLDLREAISLQSSVLNEFLERHQAVDMPLTPQASSVLMNITEMMGKNIERLNKIEHGDKVTIKIEHVQKIIIQIAEIVKFHVKNPALRERIAKDLGAVIG